MLGTTLLVTSSILASLVLINSLIAVAPKIGLMDKPNMRKTHNGDVPLIGGLSVFVAVALSVTLFVPQDNSVVLFLIAGALMVFMGILDDKYDLSVRIRLVGQFLISAILVFGVGDYIYTFGNLFGQGEIQLGLIGIPITFLAVIAAINAFNMVDGIDGLLGVCAIVAIGGLGYFFFESGQDLNFYICAAFIGALIPFLLANFGVFPFKRKIFMGDAGSMFIGLAVVWLIVSAIKVPLNSSEPLAPVMALYLIALPFMDMVAVVIRRVRGKKSPVKPGRDHAHHIMLQAGFSSKQTLFILAIVYSAIVASGFLLNQILSEFQLFLSYLFVFGVYFTIFERLEKL
ncbi:undecaprenyl-phosphate alpha-N-acetylglucosaminyl 1-phosphate transferase [Alteromonas sp. S167]|uniref:undecaprenyl-phosphate alpha-N-acetylglucosaminyl 1-phosphate transferase n=1 Tax=Alteromonas sp. S167 TaxID=3117402 RepID=UPI002FE3D198